MSGRASSGWHKVPTEWGFLGREGEGGGEVYVGHREIICELDWAKSLVCILVPDSILDYDQDSVCKMFHP